MSFVWQWALRRQEKILNMMIGRFFVGKGGLKGHGVKQSEMRDEDSGKRLCFRLKSPQFVCGSKK